MSAVVGPYARTDLQGAFDWLRSQSAEAQRKSASSIISRSNNESPEATLRLIDSLSDPEARATATWRLVDQWAREDPRTAIRAIPRMEKTAQRGMYVSAFRQWARFDPDGATAHISRVPASHRDAATLGAMQTVLSRGDADAAERLFDRIVDEETRQSAATIMHRQLSASDPERAVRYRDLSELSIGEDGSMTVRVRARE